jgi:hypothetical protein
MGYTTSFKGRLECRRAESPQLDAFLKAIRAGELATLGPFADWLQEQGDSRGEAVALLVFTEPADLWKFWRLFGLRPEHAAYLCAFNETRRMRRDEKKARKRPDPVREAAGLQIGPEGAYFVGGSGFHGQERDDSVLDYNTPPRGQPELWCGWVPDEEGTAIIWDGGEKFYSYIKWLEYLLRHFLRPWGYVLDGTLTWQGEEEMDRGRIIVVENAVTVEEEGGRKRRR